MRGRVWRRNNPVWALSIAPTGKCPLHPYARKRNVIKLPAWGRYKLSKSEPRSLRASSLGSTDLMSGLG
ncbi:hypothetical protein BC792_101281 [Sphingobacterium allocomposti]|jgi:hypothetical protein|uniref:Uncharacterized protein n=1 Tax=Sphingobacterium allocomposti TaxID=415956 RepID=A0A5S5DRS9_9SPHI|nr:hypothetical protein BC792_101281 [Sphingobacterium composti Yoo et al. 2007 non Ten et al. 2007]